MTISIKDLVGLFTKSPPPTYTGENGLHTSAADIAAVEYIAGAANCFTMTTYATTANLLTYVRLVAPPYPSTLVQLAVEVTAAGTGGSTGRIALYDNADAHEGRLSYVEQILPWRLLADSGDLAIDSTGLKTYACSVALEPGRSYWVAFMASASVTLRAVNILAISGMGWSVNTNALSLMRVPFTYAAFPAVAPIPTLQITAASPPAMRYKLS